MGSYFIFAIVLTVLYVIYYAVQYRPGPLWEERERQDGRGGLRPRPCGRHGREHQRLGERDRVQYRKREVRHGGRDGRLASCAGRRCGTRGRDRPCAVRAAEGQGGGTDGRFRPLPVRPLHVGGNVQGDGFQRLSGKPSRVEVEACQR